MHSYEIDGNRYKIIAVLAILSVPLASTVNSVIEVGIPQQFEIVLSASPLVVFSVNYYLFDRWLWNVPLIKQLISIPNLNGTWEGKIRSSYSEDGEDDSLTPIEPDGSILEINQRWSKIEIYYRNPNSSHSRSQMASFATNQLSAPELKYVYENTPEGEGHTTQNSHGGAAKLYFAEGSEGTDLLRGSYYTNQDRNGNYGDMTFQRI